MVSWIASGSLRAKMVVLWAVASVLPVVVVGLLDWRQARERLQAGLHDLLEARADQVVHEVDSFHRTRVPEAARLARLQAVRAYCGAAAGGTEPAAGLETQVHELLAGYPASDGRVRGAALLDREGRVMVASEMPLAGLDLSRQPHVRAALRGAAVVSEVHLATPEPNEKPRIAYLAPVQAPDGRFACVAALWVRAAALSQLLRNSDALAGPGSHAVLFDAQGIRIADSAGDDLLFRPAGRLEPTVVEVLVAQARFGAATRALLDDVRPAPRQFERARATTPIPGLFLSEPPAPRAVAADAPRRAAGASAVAESGAGGDYGVARRATSMPWTVVYLAPRAALDAPLAALWLDKLVQSAPLLLLAYVAGLLFVRGIVRATRKLGAVTTAIAGGNLEARCRDHSADELGRLGLSFNTMAARLQAQIVDLQRARDMLDTRVQVRTGELHRANHKLEAQAAERHLAEEAMHEGEQLLQAIVDHSSTIISVKDLKGRYLLVNRRLRELRGREEEALLGQTDHELYPPELADLMRASDQRAAVAAFALVEEERVPHEDGSVHDYLSVKCPLHDRAGRVYGTCSISTDVTALKHAAGQLQMQAERLGLLEQLAGAIGEQKDLPSLCHAALGHLEEHMRLDFSGLCRWDADAHVLVMNRMSMRSTVVAAELALSESAHVQVDSSVLWRGVHGELVHEPDISDLSFPFPQRLTRAGLRGLVVVPLYAGSQVLGVLLAARRAAGAFSSNDCDYLCQFGALLALAAQQAQMREALQRTQEDLRQARLHDAQPESLL
jgi:PAS domain S-box-containing protein